MACSRKIFAIGLNRTGTMTLNQCATILGFRSIHYDAALTRAVATRGDLSGVLRILPQYDFFSDWPWPLIYRELDALVPGSQFILTTRASETAWFESLKKHSLRTHPLRHSRKCVYGYCYPHRHERHFKEFYLRHNERARSYFAGRPGDFLELNWERGDGWEKLCAFLGKDNPAIPLPHRNQSKPWDGRSPTRHWLNRFLSYLGI